jgi:cytoskeleton protein RodZ
MNPGQTLKDKRSQMGLSINDVAVATKINPRILKALEEGQKENLPPRSFVRGFIRSYANYLKLNSEEILQAFEAEEGIAAPVVADTATPSDNKEGPNKSSRDDINRMEQSSRLGTIIVTGGIVVLIVLIFGVKKMMDRYASERVVEPTQIEGEELQAEDTTKETPTEKSEEANPNPAPADAASTTPTPVETTPTAAVAPAPTPTPAPAPAPAVVQAPTPAAPAPPVVAAPPPVVKPAPAPVVPATPPAEVAKKETPKPEVKGTPQEIIVEALDQVELTIAIDGGGSKKITLKPESIHTIKAQKEIVLEVSDGGLVNIIQNGNDRGNPGQLGKAAKLKYP